MGKYREKRVFILALAAAALILGASAGETMSYFTAYTQAKGAAKIRLGFTETIPKEKVSDWTKHINIENTGEHDCYIRVRVFAGSRYEDALKFSDPSGKWASGAGDGYYYYRDIVAPGQRTEELLVKIDGLKEEQSFNVIVVQECAPVFYDENGEPYADWNETADAEETHYTEKDKEENRS